MDDTSTRRKIGAAFADLRRFIRELKLPAESEANCCTELNKTQLAIDIAWVTKPTPGTVVAVIEDDGQPE